MSLPSFFAPSTRSFWRSADFIMAMSSIVAATHRRGSNDSARRIIALTERQTLLLLIDLSFASDRQLRFRPVDLFRHVQTLVSDGGGCQVRVPCGLFHIIRSLPADLACIP